jgi:hypothetical protein
MHKTKLVTLLSSSQRTSTTTGSAVSTLFKTNSITGDTEGYTRHMNVFLSVTAAAAGTLDLTIEGKVNGVWIPLSPSSAWTQVTTSVSEQVRRYEGPIPDEIRAVGTQATSPDHTYEVNALLGG